MFFVTGDMGIGDMSLIWIKKVINLILVLFKFFISVWVGLGGRLRYGFLSNKFSLFICSSCKI